MPAMRMETDQSPPVRSDDTFVCGDARIARMKSCGCTLSLPNAARFNPALARLIGKSVIGYRYQTGS